MEGKKAILFVNVACACGLTNSNYEWMVSTHKQYRDQGFEIFAFPCNQFGGQEPKPEAEIKQYAINKYGVEFPMF